MLGEVGWELIDSVGIDVIGAWGKNNMFGFHNHGPCKEWKTPWDQRIMVPMNFNVTYDEKGDIALVPGMQLHHPKGIRDVAEWYMSTISRPEHIKKSRIQIKNYTTANYTIEKLS
jgi:hypothetical protein